MAKQTIKGFIHFEQDPWMEKPKFSIQSCDMSNYGGYVFITEQTFDVDIPEGFNPTALHIASLEKRKAELRKKLAEELMQIDQRISELQAITYEPEVA